MDPEVVSCDTLFQEATSSPSMTSSKTSSAALRRQPVQTVEYCPLSSGAPMSEAAVDLPCGINFPQFSHCEQMFGTVDTASVIQLGNCGFAGSPQHHDEDIPSLPSTVYLKDGISGDFTSWLDQWLPVDPWGRQENPPVSSWSFLTPDLDEQSYSGTLNAQIADHLELDVLLLDGDVLLSDSWWHTEEEVSLEYTPDGSFTPESGGEQQRCETRDQHCSWHSPDEVFEMSRTDFGASSRRTSQCLQSTRKGAQRAKKTLGQRRTKTPRTLSPPSKARSIKHVRLEEIADKKGDRYKWNRRTGKNGSWENSKNESVDVMVLLRDSKAQLQMKVRPGGAKLPVDMGWSHADACFEGRAQDAGILRVSEDVMNEMFTDPQRKEGFQAI